MPAVHDADASPFREVVGPSKRDARKTYTVRAVCDAYAPHSRSRAQTGATPAAALVETAGVRRAGSATDPAVFGSVLSRSDPESCESP